MCRRSRYIRLIHLPGRRTAEDLVVGIRTTLAGVTPELRLTLTWAEIASHTLVADLSRDEVYFAHAGKPWQRPTTRTASQYFHKGTDLRAYTGDDLRRAEERLNHRPRKTLQWATPTELFAAALRSNDLECCDTTWNPP